MEEIYSRRSIRKYKAEMPPMELINKVLDAGRVAPSGHNKQPWKFLVLTGPSKERIMAAMEAGVQRERRGTDANLPAFFPNPRQGIFTIISTVRAMKLAPVLVLVMDPTGKDPYAPITAEERVAEIIDSLSIGGAVENMLLRAQELGLGSLWMAGTFWAYPELMDSLQQPGQLVCAVALGYADEEPAARPRKALEEITQYCTE